jgi:hypothetical protein
MTVSAALEGKNIMYPDHNEKNQEQGNVNVLGTEANE